MTLVLQSQFPFLNRGLTAGASNWQLSPSRPIAIRVNGKIVFDDALSDSLFTAFVTEAANGYRNHFDGSFVYGDNRFRIALFESDDGPCASVRHIPSSIRPLTSLGLPQSFMPTFNQAGLIVVTGATGSGKTATLTSIIDDFNQRHSGMIVTLENPIEFKHESKSCVVRQRELGTHFANFSEGISNSLRQDPDMIVVGEMRDQATISAALSAAETGHRVLATMHTNRATGAVSRILDAIPAGDASQQRSILSKSLRAVIAQKLVPALGGGRVAAFETLVNTLPVSNCIRTGSLEHIEDEISRGWLQGMTTFDSSLESLYRNSRITKQEALNHGYDQASLALKMAKPR